MKITDVYIPLLNYIFDEGIDENNTTLREFIDLIEVEITIEENKKLTSD